MPVVRSKFSRLMRWAVLVLVVLGLAGLATYGLGARWIDRIERMVEAGGGLGSEPLFESYFLYDMGVADIDADGTYDLFTTNHGAVQELRLNDGAGNLSDNLMGELGFDYTPALPGLRAEPVLPAPVHAGLRIDHWRSAIMLQATGTSRLGGTITLDWPATVATSGAMTAAAEGTSSWRLPATTSVRFMAEGDGRLVVEPQPAPTDGVPIRIILDEQVPLTTVRIGPDDAMPKAREVLLTPGDRHGMAWADLDGDGLTDVFVSTGGLRGRAETDDSVRDELFMGRPNGRFEDRITASGITKAGCPGRRAAWVDIDGDGRLDLYQVCGRGGERAERAAVANRLYQQGADGRFTEVAAEWGLAIEEFGTFRFLDVDGDGRADLFWAGQRRYTLYKHEGDSFRAVDLGPTPPGPGSRLRHISLGDITRNGAIDVFVASRDGNTLFLNEGGDLRPVEPASLGLPERAHTASLVDTTNSGRLDLAALPGGIYRQGEDGRFTATGALAAAPALFVSDARASWSDLDGDGALDAVIAVRPCWPGRLCAAEERGLALLRRALQQGTGLVPPDFLYEPLRWIVSLHQRHPGDEAPLGHWLAVDVAGAAGNRQSIGARVTLVQGERRQIAEVGQLEAAHQGQGNYRLHFGLGDRPDVTRIEVRWPDGAASVVEAPSSDRLVTIRHPAIEARRPAMEG